MGRTGATPASPERQGRLRAAPLGLLLLGWGLGLGPLAHAVLAHGEPLLRDSAEHGWVRHSAPDPRGVPAPRGAAPTHRHSPGGLEHLQLALFATVVALAVPVLLRRTAPGTLLVWNAPVLPRWRLPEVPGAP